MWFPKCCTRCEAQAAAFNGSSEPSLGWTATIKQVGFALCAYPCSTIEEARIKAEHLATQEMLKDELQPEQIEELLQSFRFGEAS